MDNEHIIHIITKLNILILSTAQNGPEDKQFAATIYNGGIHIHTIFGETYDDALGNATIWARENFDIPESLETIPTFEDGLAIGMEINKNE